MAERVRHPLVEVTRRTLAALLSVVAVVFVMLGSVLTWYAVREQAKRILRELG